MIPRTLLYAAILSFVSLASAQNTPDASTPASTSSAASAQPTGILPAAAAEKLLPPAILFKSQLAPVQARNSGVMRLPSGALLIASLVDNSGYSSGVRERFQFFLYTEVPLQLTASKLLPVGFYGAGFLADNTMVVLDVAGHDVMTAPTMTDAAMKRPRPLQIMNDPASGENRLYLGRSYIVLQTAPTSN